MDLKKLFTNDKAVSPVIGVVLMVAITVILAAAIGSSVFGQGPSESAPQANINIIVVDENTIKLEHLGGDTVIFGAGSTTVMFAHEDENGDLKSFELDTRTFDGQTFDVGMTKTIDLSEITVAEDGTITAAEFDMDPGAFATVKVVDVKTKQLIADKELRF